MAAICTVKAINPDGVVKAINADGEERILKAGDAIFEGETIKTTDSVVTLDLNGLEYILVAACCSC